MILAIVFAICVAGNAVWTATLPLPEKVFYDLEDAHNLFKDHVIKHQREYNNEEYLKRFEIFKESLRTINELNSKHPHTVFSVNFFADLMAEERARYVGINTLPSKNESVVPVYPPGFEAPSELDYRARGVISPIKNQGGCGSCGIFSAIGNVEAQYALKHGQCISLSEQQWVDCIPGFQCVGPLQGINPDVVWQHMAHDGNGCVREEQYPYVGEVQQCQQSRGVVSVSEGQMLSVSGDEALKDALAQYGPISVGLQSGPLHSYRGGIFNPGPSSTAVDHAVLVVGYGVENGQGFWIVKNSWGTEWGEQGYLRLIQGMDALQMTNSFAGVSSVP